MPSNSYKSCLMDLATTVTGILLSHNHSPGDAPPLEDIWPSLNKVDVKIMPTDYKESLGHSLPSFLPTCPGLDPKPLAPDSASLCSLYGSLLHGCRVLGYQQQSIWQECQHPSLPVNTVGNINAHQSIGFGPFWLVCSPRHQNRTSMAFKRGRVLHIQVKINE